MNRRAALRHIFSGVAAIALALTTVWQLSPTNAASASSLRLTRWQGADRFGTAAALARGAYPAGATNVVVASGESFPDALSASYLAGYLHAPILLTRAHALPPETSAALRTLGARHVYLVGGVMAVGDDVATQLRKVPGVSDVTREAGPTRFDTSLAIATVPPASAVSKIDGATTALLASGATFPDALAGSALAAGAGLPILLTSPQTLSPQVLIALRQLKITQVYILGGPAAVSPSEDAALNQKGITTHRLAGADRVSTAAAIGTFATSSAGFSPAGVAFARGDNAGGGVDALALGPLAGIRREPLLLTNSPTSAGTATLHYLAQFGGALTGGDAAGGPGAISPALLQQLEAAAGSGPSASLPQARSVGTVHANLTALHPTYMPLDGWSFSPDGAWYVYDVNMYDPNSPAGGQYQLRIYNVNTGADYPVLTTAGGEISDFHWAAKADVLAFTWRQGGSSQSPMLVDVWNAAFPQSVRQVAGVNVSLPPQGQVSGLTISADGLYLGLFGTVGSNPQSAGAVISDLATGQAVPLGSPGGKPIDVAWSPVGHAFASHVNNGGDPLADVGICTGSGTTCEKYLADPGDAPSYPGSLGDFSWSADGLGVTFWESVVNGETIGGQVYVYDLPTGQFIQVPSDSSLPSGEALGGWNWVIGKTGDELLLTYLSGRSQVWNPGTNAVTVLSDSDGDPFPAIAADGTEAVFYSGPDGPTASWRLANFLTNQVTSVAIPPAVSSSPVVSGQPPTNPRWSADGRKIYGTAAEQGLWSLHVASNAFTWVVQPDPQGGCYFPSSSSASGRYVLVFVQNPCSAVGSVRMFDLATGALYGSVNAQFAASEGDGTHQLGPWAKQGDMAALLDYETGLYNPPATLLLLTPGVSR